MNIETIWYGLLFWAAGAMLAFILYRAYSSREFSRGERYSFMWGLLVGFAIIAWFYGLPNFWFF